MLEASKSMAAFCATPNSHSYLPPLASFEHFFSLTVDFQVLEVLHLNLLKNECLPMPVVFSHSQELCS